ncbi:Tetratricopeptide repeat protein 4 [Sesamum angolense]|uniref:Tetratricopeptide repeat protein 4 n=1 Tax=Sesamum angolense TaxID=2727404 RepID=A0AAE1WM16_9LAMI|nr:Tetratricopeptide repeat protein 4 [Sesamum angolense]
MALWMEAGSEPKTNEEIVDLEAIAALKESAAIELKEKGNEYVKMGKKHYSDAIDCYTRAINQKALGNSESSIIYSNRAHVNLLLGNYRRALQDAEEAIKLSPTNVKALYRAVKAALSLNLMDEAKSYCEKGLQQSPDNEELKKLDKQIDVKISEQQQCEAEVSKAVAAAKADSGVCLSKKEILSYLLGGTAASHLEKFGVEETNATHSSVSSGTGPKWVRVNEKRTLHDILKSPNIIIPGIPVFFVVSKKSNFYKDFKLGNWAPPQ